MTFYIRQNSSTVTEITSGCLEDGVKGPTAGTHREFSKVMSHDYTCVYYSPNFLELYT